MKISRRKRFTAKARRTWSLGNVSNGFVPVQWYDQRNPRPYGLKPIDGNNIGSISTFRLYSP